MSVSNINIKKGFNKTYININNNISDSNEYDFKKSKLYQVRSTAAKLVEKFGNSANYKFFLKVAWRLPEHKIWKHVEEAKAARHSKPGQSAEKLFVYLCKVDGV